MAVNTNQVMMDIKSNEFHKIYLLCGEESFLRRTYRDRLLKALVAPGDTLNFSRMQGRDTDVAKLIDLAETLPFMALHRVILCEDTGFFTKKDDKLANYLKEVSDSTILIFNESEANRSVGPTRAVLNEGAFIECSTPSESVLEQWILGKLKTAGLKMTRDAWTEFVGRTGASMELMDHESDKLISYCYGREGVTLQDVLEVTSGVSVEQIFKLLDGIAMKNLNEVMKYYRPMIEAKVDPIYIIGTMQTIFRQTLYMREMADDHFDVTNIAKTFGKKDFAVRKSLSIAKAFTIDEMKGFLSYVARMDTAAKTGRMDARTALESVFIKSCS